jgi:hypothetical protein
VGVTGGKISFFLLETSARGHAVDNTASYRIFEEVEGVGGSVCGVKNISFAIALAAPWLVRNLSRRWNRRFDSLPLSDFSSQLGSLLINDLLTLEVLQGL